MTPSCVGKCLRLTFSSVLEEAMFETGESLSAISKFNSVIEKNHPIYMVLFVEQKEKMMSTIIMDHPVSAICKFVVACNR